MADLKQNFDEIIMPPLTQTSEDARIAKWLIKEGDSISVGEIILEIETDKAVVEIESTAGGVVHKIFFHEDERAVINAVLALVGKADEEVPARFDPLHRVKKKPKEETTSSQPSEETTPSPRTVSEKKSFPKGTNISPAARSLARKMNISWQNIKGTGPGGMITRKDILEHSEKK